MHLFFQGIAVQSGSPEAIPGHHCHLPALQEDHLAGVLQDSGDVGCNEHLSISQAYGHAAGVADPGSDKPVRLTTGHHHDAVGTLKTVESLPGGLLQAIGPFHVLFHQVGNHLGIRLRAEDMPFRLELPPEIEEVLHDAVVHHDDLAAAVGMRMGVVGAGTPMGRPSGVPYADVPVHG